MDNNKILFIAQEITPYLPSNELSELSRKIPQIVQEKGYEVRTFMPKYGIINERRNQLHEVIRLSGMNISIDDTDHPLIIKVATLQPTRMQVYFIDNEDFFQRSNAKGLEIVSSPADNDERIMFFVRGVVETVKKLRWEPSIVHNIGWVGALAPLYLRHLYNEDPSFRSTKIVMALVDDPFEGNLDNRFLEKLKIEGVGDDVLEGLDPEAVDYISLLKLAIRNSDGVIQVSPNVDSRLIDYVKELQLPFLPYGGEEIDADSYVDFYGKL